MQRIRKTSGGLGDKRKRWSNEWRGDAFPDDLLHEVPLFLGDDPQLGELPRQGPELPSVQGHRLHNKERYKPLYHNQRQAIPYSSVEGTVYMEFLYTVNN